MGILPRNPALFTCTTLVEKLCLGTWFYLVSYELSESNLNLHLQQNILSSVIRTWEN